MDRANITYCLKCDSPHLEVDPFTKPFKCEKCGSTERSGRFLHIGGSTYKNEYSNGGLFLTTVIDKTVDEQVREILEGGVQ